MSKGVETERSRTLEDEVLRLEERVFKGFHLQRVSRFEIFFDDGSIMRFFRNPGNGDEDRFTEVTANGGLTVFGRHGEIDPLSPGKFFAHLRTFDGKSYGDIDAVAEIDKVLDKLLQT